MRIQKFSRPVSIPLTEQTFLILKHVSDTEKISFSELVRRIIEQYMKENNLHGVLREPW